MALKDKDKNDKMWNILHNSITKLNLEEIYGSTIHPYISILNMLDKISSLKVILIKMSCEKNFHTFFKNYYLLIMFIN